MPAVLRTATFVLSIDVDPRLNFRDLAGRRALDAAMGRLFARLRDADLPATWAIAEMTALPTSQQIAAIGSHELALLGDRSWTGGTIGRGGFSAELTRRLQPWAALGTRPSTLALADGPLGMAPEMLARAGFSAVRPSIAQPSARSRGVFAAFRQLWPSSQIRPAGTTAIRPLRWGLWELQPSFDLLKTSGRAAQRAVDRIIDLNEPIHAVLDLERLAFAGRGQWGLVERTLRHIDRRRNAALLQAQSVAGLVAQVQGSLQGSPARSILRKAS